MRSLIRYSLAALSLLVSAACNTPSGNTAVASGASAPGAVYDRVIKTGIIRAAYLNYPPALMKDATTGRVSGIFAEALEQAATNLGLKVQWTEEVGWGSQIEGLEANRYDLIGSPVWANPTRGKLTTLTIPLYYSGIGVWVRQSEGRFKGLTDLNSANVKIGTIDGETGDLIARTQFPTAPRVSLPQNADIAQLFLDLKSNKSDVIFAEPYFAYMFQKANPNSVKNIVAAKPIRVLGNVYMAKKGEPQLKQMLDVAMEDLINSGFIDQLLDKYEPHPGTFYRVAYPYRANP